MSPQHRRSASARGAAGVAMLLAALALLVIIAAEPVSAQVFGPPMTVFGSVTDSDGPVAEGLDVQAFVGDTLCGEGKTEGVGEGDGRVTVYYADVVSQEQTTGCGAEGVDVRIRIGDRDAPQTVKWQAGPVQLDVTFGTATPAPIPTFTPTPTPSATETPEPGESETPTPGDGSPGATGTAGGDGSATAGPSGTIPAGSPGAGSPVPTPPGGVISTRPGGPGGDGGDDDGGFPVWAAVVLVVGGLALVGGGVGYAMARSRRERDEPDALAATDDELRPPDTNLD